jgi:hypothetical protein
MAAFGGYGWQQGIEHSQERSDRRRADVARAFQEMRNANPNATLADLSSWIEGNVGPADFYLRGTLPDENQLGRIAQENEDRKRQAELTQRMGVIESKANLRQKIDKMIDDRLMFASGSDYQGIIRDVTKELGIEGDPEMTAMVAGIAGDLDGRKRRLDNQVWTQNQPNWTSAIETMSRAGMAPDRRAFEQAIGTNVSDSNWANAQQHYESSRLAKARDDELKMFDIESKVVGNESYTNSLSVSGDNTTMAAIKAGIREQLKAVVPAADLDARIESAYNQIEGQAMIKRRALITAKQTTEAKTLIDRYDTQAKQGKDMVEGLVKSGLIPGAENAVTALSVQYSLPPEAYTSVVPEVIKTNKDFAKKNPKEQQDILLAALKDKGIVPVEIAGIEKAAAEKARQAVPYPMLQAEFERKATEKASSYIKSARSALDSVTKSIFAPDISSQSELDSLIADRKARLEAYVEDLGKLKQSLVETRLNPLERDGRWSDDAGQAAIDEIDMALKGAQRELELPIIRTTPLGTPSSAPPSEPPIDLSQFGYGAVGAGQKSAPIAGLSHSAQRRAATYMPVINQMAPQYGLDPNLIAAMTIQESGFNPDARSSKNAQGIMQLIPDTAKRFGVTDPWDPIQNLHGGMRYMVFLLNRYDGNIPLALAAYNAGEGKVDRYRGIPPYRETREYVKRIMSRYMNSQTA